MLKNWPEHQRARRRIAAAIAAGGVRCALCDQMIGNGLTLACLRR